MLTLTLVYSRSIRDRHTGIMSLDIVNLFSRGTHFTLLFIFAGCCFYNALLAPRSFRPQLSQRLFPLSAFTAAGCLFSAWLLLSVQVGMMGDNGWVDVLQLPVWKAVLGTGFGRMWRWQLGLPFISLIALFVPGQAGRILALLTALGQLCGLAFVGHAAMLDGVIGSIQRFNQSIHLISAAFWTGGLIPLLYLMLSPHHNDSRYDVIRTLIRFSWWGHLAVALVILTGIVDGWLILGWPLQSFHLYSQLLLIKIILVLTMVGIALFNRYCLVPRFRIAGDPAQQRFIVMTCLELLLSTGVVILVTIFATHAPG